MECYGWRRGIDAHRAVAAEYSGDSFCYVTEIGRPGWFTCYIADVCFIKGSSSCWSIYLLTVASNAQQHMLDILYAVCKEGFKTSSLVSLLHESPDDFMCCNTIS